MKDLNASRLTHAAATAAVCICFAAPVLGQNVLFNGSLTKGEAAASRPDAAHVARLREVGWTCPDSLDWPMWWQPVGTNVELKAYEQGGKQAGYCSMSGKDGYIRCPAYPLAQWRQWLKEDKQQKFGDDTLFSIWAKGRGTLTVHFNAFSRDEDGNDTPIGNLPPLTVRVNGNAWVQYCRVIPHQPDLFRVLPAVSVPEGRVDFDELSLGPVTPARALLFTEMSQLYGTGALIEDMQSVAADATFRRQADECAAAIQTFRAAKADIDANLFQSIEDEIGALSPYILIDGISIVEVTRYNDVVALTRALKRLTGEDPGKAVAIKAEQVKRSRIWHKPGVRYPRGGTVTITDVRSNKVRYLENETAETTVSLVSQWRDGRTPPEIDGQLIARLIVDLDTVREVARTDFQLTTPSRHIRVEKGSWTFSFNVGPETYGRALEIELINGDGTTVDKWQEYFAVAEEFFRVQQHTFHSIPNRRYEVTPWTTYFNQLHYFASELSGFGVQVSDVEAYDSSQGGYRMNWRSRRRAMDEFTAAGVAITFYQINAFGGQMGYEEMRKHPEYVMYDPNGQFSVDPIYGGYPNPMELASPMEVGPKREQLKIKPHLDRRYRPWQHSMANLANEDAVRYAATCIKEYAEAHGFHGIYWDGNVGVWPGYGYDGTRTTPTGSPAEYTRLNARNHRIYSEILKADNPNFGTWYNWAWPGIKWCLDSGVTMVYGSGTGYKGDDTDDTVRTALSFRNVMMLDERHSFFKPGEYDARYPDKTLASLLEQRDFVVQKYEGNTIIGYQGASLSAEEPGPSRWGWVGVNYLMAQFTATQHHLAAAFYPSYRPQLQFLTRYSRFIWARDIKAVPVEEVDRIVKLETPEPIWWKRLVYKRKTDNGHDLILHLLRIPPTRKWDINWVDAPVPLEGVTISVDTGDLPEVGLAKTGANVAAAYACRPYYFEEPQQVVQTALVPVADGDTVTITVPPFRYHTMVVLRSEAN